MPQAGEPDPWWPQLLSAAEDMPRVIARLPFAAHGNARTNGAEALTIGFGAQQESGLDRTWLASNAPANVDAGPDLEASLRWRGSSAPFSQKAMDGRRSI